MNLRDYEWFHNPRGLHNGGPARPFVLGRYTRPHMGWATLVAVGDEYEAAAAQLIEQHCMPIVCLHRPNVGAAPVPAAWYDIYRTYLEAGCRWFELYSEPNNPAMWPQNPDGQPLTAVDWRNTKGCIKPLMDNWLDWAERLIDLGGYPAFPALAESDALSQATVYWLDAMLRYLKEAHAERFLSVVGSGLWCATHPYLLNRFYQELPDGPRHVARPPHQQRGDEAGWHFEYPYDPLIQSHDPGRTVFGATTQAPYGAPNGLISTGEAFQQLLKHHFGVGPVPVIGTAGGITPIPRADEAPLQPDALYPPYDHQSHAEATLALTRWIATSGPPWLFGLTLSDEAEYYEKQDEVPAIRRLAETPPVLKEVPALETGGTLRRRARVETPEPVFPTSEEVGEVEEEVPDWLAEIDLSAEVEEAAASPPSAAPEEAIPDWLTELDLDVEESDLVTADEASATPEEGVPDWLAELEHAPGETIAPSEPVEVEEELPDWLSEALGIEEAPEIALKLEEAAPPVAEAEETTTAEEVPDWLAELDLTVEETPPVAPEAAPEPPTAPTPTLEEEEVPTWLAEIVPPEGAEGEVEAPEAPEPVPTEVPHIPSEEAPITPAAMPEAAPSPPTAEPDMHWLLMVTPGFEPRWFFLAGGRYWETFRPTIVTEWSQVELVPPDKRLAVTILVSTDMAGLIENQVKDAPPNVQVDLIPVASLDELRAELNWRAIAGKRLG